MIVHEEAVESNTEHFGSAKADPGLRRLGAASMEGIGEQRPTCGADGHPSLVALACVEVARHLGSEEHCPPHRLSSLSERLRMRLLACCIAEGTLTDGVMAHFAASELKLRGSRVSDRGLCLLGRACGSRLLSLDISFCPRLKDTGLIALVHECPQLLQLQLAHCRFSDAAIERLVRSCAGLRTLDCSWNGSGITDRGVRAIGKHCLRLEKLALNGCRMSDDTLLALACALPQLTQLLTKGCDLSESGMTAALYVLPRLEVVELSQIARLSEPSLQLLLPRMSRVTRLDVSMCMRLGDVAISRAAATLPQLTVLECYGVSQLRAPTLEAARLRTLVLSGCRALATPSLVCPALETLELQSCRELRPEALALACRTCPALRCIDLAGCKELRVLVLAAPSLCELRLDGCVKLERLEWALPALRTLMVRGCEALHVTLRLHACAHHGAPPSSHR